MQLIRTRVNGLDEKVALLVDQVARDVQRPQTQMFARRGISGLDSGLPYDANALALCLWVRQLVRYTRERPETFVDVPRLLQLGAGDCDDMAAMLAAFLWTLGYRVEFVVGVDASGRQGHIWVRAWSPRLVRWLHLDPTPFVDPGTNPVDAGLGLVRWRNFPINVEVR